jgi:hypothetical protein
MMRLKYLVFALALLPVSAASQEKKDAAPQSSTSVLINGQQIKGKVLEIDGKHFVAIEDLAQSLRGTISYGDGQIALTFSQFSSVTTQATPSQPQTVSSQATPSQPQPSPAQTRPSVTPTMPTQPTSSQLPPVTAQTPEPGRVKGTLTYFFSFQVGTKPDAGSKVWLVKGRAEIPADQNLVATSTALGTSGNPEQYNAFKYSLADENGNFELLDIPPGPYTLIMQSAHTKGTLKEKTHIFGKGNSRSPRDRNGRVESLNLLIKPGETADASKDFGPNIDM